MLAMALLMAGTLTAAANVWGVKRINSRMLRQVGPQASELLGREVRCTCHVLCMPCHATPCTRFTFSVSSCYDTRSTYTLEPDCWTSTVHCNWKHWKLDQYAIHTYVLYADIHVHKAQHSSKVLRHNTVCWSCKRAEPVEAAYVNRMGYAHIQLIATAA